MRPRLKVPGGKSDNSTNKELAERFGWLELIKSFSANVPVFSS